MWTLQRLVLYVYYRHSRSDAGKDTTSLVSWPMITAEDWRLILYVGSVYC